MYTLTSTIDPGGFGQLLSKTLVGKLFASRRRWDFLTYATNLKGKIHVFGRIISRKL